MEIWISRFDVTVGFLQPEARLPQQVVQLVVQCFLSAAICCTDNCTVFHKRILRPESLRLWPSFISMYFSTVLRLKPLLYAADFGTVLQCRDGVFRITL